MANVSTGSAKYEGFGKDGKGHVSTGSGALDNQPYGFKTRFEDEPGTNPEELIAAAHASCFTMALSFQLAGKGHSDGTIETTCAVTPPKKVNARACDPVQSGRLCVMVASAYV